MSVSNKNYKRTKHACYYTYLSMSSAFSLPPLLFVTFREMYGISYTLLGTLVLVNFCTQLLIDLIFTFFTKYFNIHKTIRIMPLLTSAGLLTYAAIPMLIPQYAYAGLLVGTVIFSVAAGLCEVLLSPLIAALPSDNPERDMSMLHSLYGYGVVSVVMISTAALRLFGTDNWMYLTMFWAILPVISFVLFSVSPMPEMNMAQDTSSDTPSAEPSITGYPDDASCETSPAGSCITGFPESKISDAVKRKTTGLTLCVLCIFLGSAAENAMTNWISGYMENALQLPKVVGDILGMALFAALLALGRTFYAQYGKNISAILLWSMIGAAACYLIAGLSANLIVSMAACVLTGLCTSMLWPGTLILMEEKIPNPGVAAYALMAAGGDFGGSVAPQLLGIVVDTVSASNWAAQLGGRLSLSAEQIGMKAGMLTAAIFPLLGIGLLIYIRRYFSKRTKQEIVDYHYG